MTVGSVFIMKGTDTLIVVEKLYADHFSFRYIVTDSAAQVGKVDWALYTSFHSRWEQVA